jgi:hypothetical protein
MSSRVVVTQVGNREVVKVVREGPPGPPGEGLPSGGVTGDLLVRDTSNPDGGAWQSTLEKIDFDLTAAPALTTGRLAWNPDDGTLDVGLLGDSILQVGQEQLYFAKNSSGSQVVSGTAVMFYEPVGASGKLSFVKAVSDGSVSYEYMMGVVTKAIDNGDFGYVTTFGLVRGFDTSGAAKTVPESWADGDLLYFDAAYPGELTKVEPAAPAFHSPVAVVIRAATGGSGSVFVRMKTGESLGELHDVKINGTLVDGDILRWDDADERWENRAYEAVDSSTVREIVSLTQAQYDALTPVSTTLYVITE